MWTDKQRQLAKDLLSKTSVSPETISECGDDDKLLRLAVGVAAEIFDYWHAPSDTWHRDCYKLIGKHMVLTEAGWISPDSNFFEPLEVLDEVGKHNVLLN